jgi:hypothetical protein
MKIIFLIILLTTTSIVFAQHSRFDEGIPNKIQVYKSLYDLQYLLNKDKPNVQDVYLIYSNELIVGRYYLGIGEIDTLPINYNYRGRRDGRYGVDSLKFYCAKYLKNNFKRFRNILSGWKDEDSFYEPNYYWLEYIKKIDSTSIEVQLISFDLEFKDLIRQYETDINRESFGLSCEEFYTMWAKRYKEKEKKEILMELIPKCEEKRKEFVKQKERILKKYNYAPFTKILQNIDETEIVIFWDFSEC